MLFFRFFGGTSRFLCGFLFLCGVAFGKGLGNGGGNGRIEFFLVGLGLGGGGFLGGLFALGGLFFQPRVRIVQNGSV